MVWADPLWPNEVKYDDNSATHMMCSDWIREWVLQFVMHHWSRVSFVVVGLSKLRAAMPVGLPGGLG